AVSRPPFGMVISSRGKWALHPDPDVREALARPFDLYFRLHSVKKVVRYYDAHGLLHPHQVAGKIVWKPISAFEVLRLIRNPNYTPDYVYLRIRHSPRGASKYSRKWRPRSEWLTIKNHHEGVVSHERFNAIQVMLDNNRLSNRPPTLDGPA